MLSEWLLFVVAAAWAASGFVPRLHKWVPVIAVLALLAMIVSNHV